MLAGQIHDSLSLFCVLGKEWLCHSGLSLACDLLVSAEITGMYHHALLKCFVESFGSVESMVNTQIVLAKSNCVLVAYIDPCPDTKCYVDRQTVDRSLSRNHTESQVVAWLVECLPNMRETCRFQPCIKLGMASHTDHPSTWEVEVCSKPGWSIY